MKILVARILNSIKLFDAVFKTFNSHWYPYIRVVNYHDIRPENVDNFEKQLKYYRKYYHPTTLDDLVGLFNLQWSHDKVGLIITFDDGDKSAITIAKPLLEKYGFQGWFFVPTAFINQQGHLSIDDLRILDTNHIIGCHTRSHYRLTASTHLHKLRDEIIGSKSILEEYLGHEVQSFAWVGGELISYSQVASIYIKRADYKYAFMTNSYPVFPKANPLQLQRTNIEASWPIELVKFQLSGIMDMLYTPKRLIVNRITK